MDYHCAASLPDRVAIVTGAAGGIGFEASKALQDHGATVVLTDINADRGKLAAQELGVEFFRADLTRSAEVRRLAEHVQQRYGRIDIAFSIASKKSIVDRERQAVRTLALL